MRRRNFLRGACGVAVALPLLESLHWRRFMSTAKAAGAPQKRLLVYFTCNGVNLETFYPTTPYGALTVDLVEDDFTQLQSLGKEDAMALACGATNVACSTTARSCGATRAAAR